MPMPLRKLILAAAILMPLLPAPQAAAQAIPAPHSRPAPAPASPATPPGGPPSDALITPGMLQLLTLDGQFSQAVNKSGGAAFASWFANDAVTLNNGKEPVLGKTRIAAAAHWRPEDYQLVWQPMGAQMGPSGDMGFTWGHYDATTKDKNGKAVTTGGRYITMWKRMTDGKWKVALDASANDPSANNPSTNNPSANNPSANNPGTSSPATPAPMGTPNP